MTFSIAGSQIFFANFVIFARNERKNAYRFIVHNTTGWCVIFLLRQAWISLLRLPKPNDKRKTVLKVKCFKKASLNDSKGAFVARGVPVKDSRKEYHSDPWVCLCRNYPEMSEIVIFDDINLVDTVSEVIKLWKALASAVQEPG